MDFFARAEPEDVGDILDAFLETDEAKVMATLADINHHKAIKLISATSSAVSLIGAVGAEAALLALPDAAQAIARKAAGLRWTEAGSLERTGEGYTRKYKDGCVFWSERFGARVVVDVVEDYCRAGPFMGFPIGDEESAPSSPFGTEGTRQKFQMGTVYSSEHGVYLVRHFECCGEGDSGGWLGFPVGEADVIRDDLRLQPFEGGVIYSLIGAGAAAIAVRAGLLDALPGVRRIRPVSKEADTISSSGTAARVQRFQNIRGKEMAVYSSGEHGVVMVDSTVWDYYHEMGGEASWLGLPVRASSLACHAGAVKIQRFEGGAIYRISGVRCDQEGEFHEFDDLFAVPIATQEIISPDGQLPGMIGFPVSDDKPAETGGGDRIQFFDKGVATLRDGKREIWVRPSE